MMNDEIMSDMNDELIRPAYFFFVSATQSATSATFKLQLIHLII